MIISIGQFSCWQYTILPLTIQMDKYLKADVTNPQKAWQKYSIGFHIWLSGDIKICGVDGNLSWERECTQLTSFVHLALFLCMYQYTVSPVICFCNWDLHYRICFFPTAHDVGFKHYLFFFFFGYYPLSWWKIFDQIVTNMWNVYIHMYSISTLLRSQMRFSALPVVSFETALKHWVFRF